MEAIHVHQLMNGWKKWGIYPSSGILFANNKELNINTCYNTELWKHCAQWKALITKKTHIIPLILNVQNKQI